jgi:hypothetical protein
MMGERDNWMPRPASPTVIERVAAVDATGQAEINFSSARAALRVAVGTPFLRLDQAALVFASAHR